MLRQVPSLFCIDNRLAGDTVYVAFLERGYVP
jgi:hypothetical protein